MQQTLFEQLGGADGVNAAVDLFYRKVLSDPRVNYWFDDIDMEKQAIKQKGFMMMAFGGPHNYSGRDMRAAHKPLVERGLNDTHFDAIKELLTSTLTEMGVAEDLVQQVAAVVESTRDDVLNREPAGATA